jgi:hypothetical protein
MSMPAENRSHAAIPKVASMTRAGRAPLIEKDDVQKRWVNFNFAVVFNES